MRGVVSRTAQDVENKKSEIGQFALQVDTKQASAEALRLEGDTLGFFFVCNSLKLYLFADSFFFKK